MIIIELSKDLVDEFVISLESELFEGVLEFLGINNSTEITVKDVESDFDVSGFQAGDTFFLDGTPIPPLFNANGISRAGQDEVPYGWGSVAPGTFQFDEAFIGVAP